MKAQSNKVPSILVIDDNPVNLEVAVGLLQENEFRALIARKGVTGINRARLAQPDLILLDIFMPEVDGFETCRRLKADDATKDIPIIFMTASTETVHKVLGFNLGAVDYVTKPFQQEELLARINTHLQLNQLKKNLAQQVQERTAELDDAYQKLAVLDKAKIDFINVASHELRTPLAVIEGYLQILEDHLASTGDDAGQSLVQQTMRGSKRMLKIVNQILVMAQLENNTIEMNVADVVPIYIVRNVYAELKPVLRQRQLTLTFDGLRDVPRVAGDKNLLEKCFYQIVVNAIKYTPDGGDIEVYSRIDDNELEIVFQDSGIGIDSQHLSMIFEKFYQVGTFHLHSSGTTSYKGGGPGIGLAIARQIVDLHDGRIWAESSGYDEKNFPGSRFFVRLPIAS